MIVAAAKRTTGDVSEVRRSTRLGLLFDKAKVPRAYPYLFRDTFAMDLLQKGASLQTVAVLLGHSSTRITEKRYKSLD